MAQQQTRGHEKSALVQLLIFTAIFICNFFLQSAGIQKVYDRSFIALF